MNTDQTKKSDQLQTGEDSNAVASVEVASVEAHVAAWSAPAGQAPVQRCEGITSLADRLADRSVEAERNSAGDTLGIQPLTGAIGTRALHNGAMNTEAALGASAVVTTGHEAPPRAGGLDAEGLKNEDTENRAVGAEEKKIGANVASQTGESENALELLEGTALRGESSAAIIACNDFLLFGPARSVRGLAQLYKEQPKSEVPTQSYDTLRRWSEKHDWIKRANQYNARMRREAMAARQEVYEKGHAAAVSRVESLSKIAKILEEQILEVGMPENTRVLARCSDCQSLMFVDTGELVDTRPNLWTTTVKQVGTGDSARVTTTRRFNGAIIAQFRSVLDDIAKETNGRRFDLVERIISRLEFRLLPKEFAERIASGDNLENALVELIETFYTDDIRVHYKRSLPRR
jgi:hypothetical protein